MPEIRGGAASAPKVDYREILSQQEFALYEKLRALRKEFAEKQGLPVYAVFTNEQLATMIKNRAASLKDIAALPGVGESKIKQYGAAFLAVITENTPAEPAKAEPHETGELPL